MSRFQYSRVFCLASSLVVLGACGPSSSAARDGRPADADRDASEETGTDDTLSPDGTAPDIDVSDADAPLDEATDADATPDGADGQDANPDAPPNSVAEWDQLPAALDERPLNEDCLPIRPPPTRLSETGCFAGTPLVPRPALLPYDVQAPLWSDGSDKGRWFALPEGAQITVDRRGSLVFPPGSVLVKSFGDAERVYETRFLVLHEDETWEAYSYVWDAAQADAVLALEGATFLRDSAPAWEVPSQADCATCHTDPDNMVLGLQLPQLNWEMTYPQTERTANQLATLRAVGALDTGDLGPPETLAQMPAYDDPHASDADKARAYLHANCAHCHSPGGEGAGNLDLRYSTGAAFLNVCDAMPEFGDVAGETWPLVWPGDPERSNLLARMRTTDDAFRMPPLASEVVDELGVTLVEAWIAGLEGCE